MSSRDQIAQALLDDQAVVPPPQPGAQNPYLLNQPLEQAVQAQTQAPPMNPLIAAIMKHMGLLNIVRNRGNQQMADPEIPLQ